MRISVLTFWLCVTFALAPPARAQQSSFCTLEPWTVEFEWAPRAGEQSPETTIFRTNPDGVAGYLSFNLPTDCSDFTQHQDFLNQHSRTSVEINRFLGAIDYCEHAAELEAGRAAAQYDYVSNLDYDSLPLDVIPYTLHCLGLVSDQMRAFCEAVQEQDPNVCLTGEFNNQLSYASFQIIVTAEAEQKLDCQVVRVDPVSCRLEQGRFIGTIDTIDGMRKCSREETGRDGVRLYDVCFRDINVDGYMDAYISVIKELDGGTISPRTYRFTLTRKGENSQLERIVE